MVGKRRPHKARLPYKRVVGSGTITGGEEDEEVPDLTSESDEKKASSAELTDQGGEAIISATGPFRDFPLEIIDIICSMVPRKFPLLLVNHRWHDMALRHVYSYPKLTPTNFAQFVLAISNDRNLGALVHELDLVKIAQVGKNSMVSRLLRRCSPKLEQFYAPQAHFGYSPIISLAACKRLKVLDLSLVSETVDLPQLFSTIEKFQDLEVLHFPRSSIKCGDDSSMKWAPNLRKLGLSGGFPPQFLETTQFPSGLSELHVSNCPYMTSQSLHSLLTKLGPQLKRLSIVYPVPLLAADALDFVFTMCPNITTLTVSVDYISSAALESERIPDGHPLTNITLASSGLMGHADKIRPGDMLLATESFPNLKRVSTSLLLGWNPEASTLMGLVDALNERGGGVWLV